MLLRLLYLQLILLLPNNCLPAELFTYNVGKIITEPKTDSENIFTDVIKNISRVNDALQNLIHNYEQIQKLYATDSFEKDYSSDAEIDESYKNKKKNKKTKSRTNLEDTKPKKNFPATVMFVSVENESEIEDNGSDTDKEVRKTIKDQVVEATTKHIVQEARLHDTKDSQLIKTLKNSSIDEKHKNRRPQIIILHPQHREPFENVNSNKTQLASSTKQPKRKRRKPLNTIPTEANTETTTHVPRQKLRNVKKVIFAESFPQGKIWKEIAQKKPIKLRALKMPPRFKIQNIRFRSNNKSHKTALVIVAKNNKRTDNSFDIPASLEHIFSSDWEELNTKIIKANILRDDYGMACLRLVVKKCYKACKETKKAACGVTTCKSSFKEKFMDNAKKGCIKEFRHNDTSQKNNNNTFFLKKYSKSDFDDDSDDDDFADITRSGFPAETCYPFMIPQAQRDNPETNNNSTLTPVDLEKKILRDRYERACARASSDKCYNACLYAYKMTCDTYECSKGTKKQFRKHCKRQCKNAYKPKENDRRSDSSSSSTWESSESGSDSTSDDFDTEDFE